MRFETPLGPFVGHHGGTQGFEAFLAARPGETPFVVAVMVNNGSFAEAVGFRLASVVAAGW